MTMDFVRNPCHPACVLRSAIVRNVLLTIVSSDSQNFTISPVIRCLSRYPLCRLISGVALEVADPKDSVKLNQSPHGL